MTANQITPMPISKAIDEMLHVKRWGGRREKYVRRCEHYLRMFARGREQQEVHTFTEKTILDWFTSRNEKPVTMVSNLGVLSSMFQVCWRRRYIHENPIQRIDRPYVDREAPKVFTLRQCAKILIYARRKIPDALPWITMTLLCGIRPEEADKIGWDKIDLKRGEIRIDASVSKVRRRRLVHLTPAARAWLSLAPRGELPLTYMKRRRFMWKIRRLMGYKIWPADISRHTAASYLLASIESAERVAMELGNSAGVLHRHYKELLPKEDGDRFVNLLPSRNMMRRWKPDL